MGGLIFGPDRGNKRAGVCCGTRREAPKSEMRVTG